MPATALPPPLRRRRPIKSARVNHAGPATPGPDDLLRPIALIGAFAKRVARRFRQNGAGSGRIVRVRLGHLDAADQPGLLVSRYMRLVAVHWLAAPVQATRAQVSLARI